MVGHLGGVSKNSLESEGRRGEVSRNVPGGERSGGNGFGGRGLFGPLCKKLFRVFASNAA